MSPNDGFQERYKVRKLLAVSCVTAAPHRRVCRGEVAKLIDGGDGYRYTDPLARLIKTYARMAMIYLVFSREAKHESARARRRRRRKRQRKVKFKPRESRKRVKRWIDS